VALEKSARFAIFEAFAQRFCLDFSPFCSLSLSSIATVNSRNVSEGSRDNAASLLLLKAIQANVSYQLFLKPPQTTQTHRQEHAIVIPRSPNTTLMPHATSDNMSAPMVNGDSKSSKFLTHLNSYPVVSDGVETFKSNSYGRKSIDLADSAYQRFGKPVEPYLETPYSYAKPYVNKADELADTGLGHVETRFPIVKEDTTTIVDKGKSIVWFPFKLADDGRTYLVNTWQGMSSQT
jgi:hypothetical protein